MPQPKAIDIGSMRTRLAFIALTESINEFGERIMSESPAFETYGRAESIPRSERLADQDVAANEVAVTVRSTAETRSVGIGWRVNASEPGWVRTLNVAAIGRDGTRLITFYCVEVAADGAGR